MQALQLRSTLTAMANSPLPSRHRGAGLAVLFALMFPELSHADDERVTRPGYSLQVEQRGQGPQVNVFESGFGQGVDALKDVAVADAAAEAGERLPAALSD